MKLVILDGYTENPGDLSWEALEALGDVTVYEHTPENCILERIGDAPVVLTNKTPITAETIAQKPQLRYIGVLATGYNVVDIEAASERGIVVTNVPAYSTQAVAQPGPAADGEAATAAAAADTSTAGSTDQDPAAAVTDARLEIVPPGASDAAAAGGALAELGALAGSQLDDVGLGHSLTP